MSARSYINFAWHTFTTRRHLCSVCLSLKSSRSAGRWSNAIACQNFLCGIKMGDQHAITNICRACLSESGNFQSIFVSDEPQTGLKLHLSEMIGAFSSVQVTLGDGLPEEICLNCAKKTVELYLFKVQCEQSDLVLRRRLLLQTKLPVEILIKPELVAEDFQPALVDNSIGNDFNLFDADLVKSSSSSESESDVEQVDSVPRTISKDFECEICQKKFSREDLLLRHKIAHAMKIQIEEADDEEDGDDETETYKVQRQNAIVIKSEDLLYSCSRCELLFIAKEQLAFHMAKHEKEDKYVCEICRKTFKKRGHLTRHLKTHSSAKPHTCKICNKSFARSEQLTNHSNLHSGVKPHTCSTCLKGFNQISNLKDHMRTHNGERPFLCSTCGKGFNQLGNLRQHTIRHSGIKAHLCSTCGSGFASKGELSAHLRKHTGARPFVCMTCNHGFTTSSSLTKHKRIHSGEKPYECDVCKMKFSRSGILARHKRTHTGEKPYVCQYCTKAFTQSNDLTSHLRIHTGEKPYICDVCGQAFRQSSALKTHKKTHERGQDDGKVALDWKYENKEFC